MNMDLSDDERRLIEVIVGGEKAWSKVKALEAAGHSLETIADLMLREILEKWDHPDDGDSITLAPLGAWIWERLRAETLELAERPITIHRLKRERGEVVQVRESERVNFWVEGARPDKRRTRRHVEDYGLMAALVRDKADGPELVVDEVSGNPIELFMGLFNGVKVKGIPVVVDRRVKGKPKGKARTKGKGGAKQPKARRRAG